MRQTNLEGDHLNEQELIRKYLDNELTPEEEILVAERYESDAEFRDALDGMEMLSGSDFSDLMIDISDKIDKKISAAAGSGQVIDISDADAGESKVIKLRSFRRMAIAASVVLLLFVGGTIMMNQIKTPTQKLVASNFQPKPYPDLITRGDSDDLSQLEKVAISAYNSENFEVSVKHFRDLYIQYPNIEKYGLFLGISQMGLSNYQDAIKTLSGLKERSETYSDDLDWYLGLSYLKMQQPELARPLFEGLAADQNSYYREAARKIFKKLK